MEASWATYLIALITPHMTYDLLQDLFQMGASSYPGMTQPFSMAHSTNMGSVGVRQDSMGEFHGTICLLSISSDKTPCHSLALALSLDLGLSLSLSHLATWPTASGRGLT